MMTRSATSTAASIAAATPGGLSTRTSSPDSLVNARTPPAVPGLTSKGNGVPQCAARSAQDDADPCGSASMTRTGTPRCVAAAAKNSAVVVFPTPPLVCTSDQITILAPAPQLETRLFARDRTPPEGTVDNSSNAGVAPARSHTSPLLLTPRRRRTVPPGVPAIRHSDHEARQIILPSAPSTARTFELCMNFDTADRVHPKKAKTIPKVVKITGLPTPGFHSRTVRGPPEHQLGLKRRKVPKSPDYPASEGISMLSGRVATNSSTLDTEFAREIIFARRTARF